MSQATFTQNPPGTRRVADTPAVPNRAAPLGTGTFLDRLPDALPESAGAEAGGLAQLRTLSLVVRLRAQQDLYAPRVADPAAPAWDSLPEERFGLRGGTAAARVRYLLSQCAGEDTASRIFGYADSLGDGRLVVGDFLSEQLRESEAPEPWKAAPEAAPFARTVDVAPTGTVLWSVWTLDEPSLADLATVLAVFELAASNGFATLRSRFGKCSLSVRALYDGLLQPEEATACLLESLADGGEPGALEQLAPAGALKGRLVVGSRADIAAKSIARRSPLHPLFGEDDL